MTSATTTKSSGLRKGALKLATVTEMKALNLHPPRLVKQLTVPMFMLMGQKEVDAKDWRHMQILLRETSTEKLNNVDVSKLDENKVDRIRALLMGLDPDSARNVSQSAYDILVWCRTKVAEYDKQNSS